MTGPLDTAHGDWDALAVGWAMSALDPEDESRFAEHLPGCPRCISTVRESLHTVAELAYALPEEAPPRRLRHRIIDLAAAEPPPEPIPIDLGVPDRRARAGIPRGTATAGTSQQRRWVRAAAVAAGVTLIAALTVWNIRLHSDQDRLRDVVAQRDALVTRLTEAGPARVAVIRGPEGSGERRATVVVKQGRVGLVTETLPPDAPGQTYWLWSLRGPTDQDPVPLAGFSVPESRFSACNIEPPAGVDVSRAFAISAEPGTARPTRPTDIVAFGSIGPT